VIERSLRLLRMILPTIESRKVLIDDSNHLKANVSIWKIVFLLQQFVLIRELMPYLHHS